MTRPFKQVDVFTSTLGLGNPVAVVLDAEGLTDEAMRSFAAWTNLSETTFVLPPSEPEADYHVRIFTPTEELPFAGHPTIGTCHAWLEAGGRQKSAEQIVQQCGAGLVALHRVDGRLAFETPPMIRSGPVDPTYVAMVLGVLGVAPGDVVDTAWLDNGPGWVGVLLHDVEVLRSLQPKMEPGKLDIGVAAFRTAGIAALIGANDGTEPALEVRAFFDAGGIREDPVTGSLNGSLAQWLLGNGRLTSPYVASQGTSMGRDGRVYVSQRSDGSIWIGGNAVTAIDGVTSLR